MLSFVNLLFIIFRLWYDHTNTSLLDLFVKWLVHFIERTKTSMEQPCILIVDGHNSHKTLEAVELARGNGITMIILPPHCTHKMQPLDGTFFKSLKANYNRAADNFMTTNVGKRITFYEMADIFGKAYGISATVEKAVKGFETTGIWPFGDNKFGEEDFAAADMTDEPLPAAVSGGIESLSGNEELGLEAIVAHTNTDGTGEAHEATVTQSGTEHVCSNGPAGGGDLLYEDPSSDASAASSGYF